jgi:hypothetical protein
MTPEEQAIVNEVRTMLASPQVNELREGFRAGKEVTVHFGARYVYYDPAIPAAYSGSCDVQGNGFTIAQGAFKSDAEFRKTFLHEMHRLVTSKVLRGQIDGDSMQQAASAETKAAFDFAEQAYPQVANANPPSAGTGRSPGGGGGGPGGTTISPEGHVAIMNGIVGAQQLLQWVIQVTGGFADPDKQFDQDAAERADYVNHQKDTDARLGTLLVVAFQTYSPPDAIQTMRTYKGMVVFQAPTVGAAQGMARKDVPNTFEMASPPNNLVWYEYQYAWVPPLRPEVPALQPAAAPSDPLYQRYLQVRRAVEPPAPYPYTECFNLLNGSWMYHILRILDMIAKDGYFNLLFNLLPRATGIDVSRLTAAFGAVRASWTRGEVFEWYKSSYAKDFFALPEGQQKEIEDFLTKKPARAADVLLGKWKVQVQSWTWIYEFKYGGAVRWTDLFNTGTTGKGTWKVTDSQVVISWAPDSKTTEAWDLPVDPANQAGKCFKEEGTYALKAVKQ